MTRIPLLATKNGLSDRQTEVFDAIVESRGSMIRPYEVLLHAPGLAQPAGALGAQIRYHGALSDHDRELAIITTARIHDCRFEWDSHVGIARDAGVADGVIEVIDRGEGTLPDREAIIVGFVRELCSSSTITDETFAAAHDLLGDSQVVELSALVGYYTMLAYVMNTAGAC